MEQTALSFGEARDLPAPDLDSYDHILVMFSGGKDSVACVLYLLESGVSRDRIELWHHDIDGREGPPLMDWPVTPGYCRAFADAFGLKLFFSWKEGGFEREMLRADAPTAPTHFETPDGVQTCGGRGPKNTRRMFPQPSADLRVRWCSAYCKIDVAAAAIRNQARFDGKRLLVVTGERGQESPQRARYAALEAHKSDGREGRKRRLVDHWRPLLDWREESVWGIIERWRVRPHPAYFLGFGRCSCAFCIFGSRNQVASARQILPTQYRRVRDYETEFGRTIHRTESLDERAAGGTPYAETSDESLTDLAAGKDFDLAILMVEGEWRLPSGAFGEGCGPS